MLAVLAASRRLPPAPAAVVVLLRNVKLLQTDARREAIRDGDAAATPPAVSDADVLVSAAAAAAGLAPASS
jgi:hypothetical protein